MQLILRANPNEHVEIGLKHFTGKSGCILAPVMAAILLSTSAAADSYYGGITFGNHSFDTNIRTNKDGVLNAAASTGSIFVGKPMNERVSVEAAYIDFGKATIRATPGSIFNFDGSQYEFLSVNSVTYSAKSISVAGKFHFDVARKTRLSVKLGIHKWNSKLAARGAGRFANIKTSGTDALVGFGAEYNISDKVNLIAGLDNYVLGDERIPNGYLGLSISFGTPKRS